MQSLKDLQNNAKRSNIGVIIHTEGKENMEQKNYLKKNS